MNVGSDIKIFDIRNFDEYTEDGWREGFNLSWKGAYATNKFYKNTILVRSNYIRSTNSINPNGGNGYEDVDTFSGFKFLFKPKSATEIQWVLLYVFVRTVDNGGRWFHRFGNLWNLVIDGKTVVDMPKTATGEYTAFADYTAPVLSNGAGSQKNNTVKSIDNYPVKLGMLIPPVQSGNIVEGTSQVVFYGTFTPSSHITSQSQTFPVKFTYGNWAFMSAYQGTQKTTATAIALEPKWWGSKQSWSMKSIKDTFMAKTYQATQNAMFVGQQDIETLSAGYASYGQTISVVGGNYILASSTGDDVPTWSSTWRTTPQNITLKAGGTDDFPTQPRSTMTVRTSYWNASNYGANWCAQSTVKLQYKPNTSKYTITDQKQEGVSVGCKIAFKKLTPEGKNGYFNSVKIIKKSGTDATYVEHDFTQSVATLTIVRDKTTGVLTTSSSAGDTIINNSINIGTDEVTFYVYACYHDASDETDHSNDLLGSRIDWVLPNVTAQPSPEPELNITSFDLIYPVGTNGITHIIKNRTNDTYKTDFFMQFTTDESMQVGHAYVALLDENQTVIKQRVFNITSGVNKVVLESADFTNRESDSYYLRLKIMDETDSRVVGTVDLIPVSIKKHAYDASRISVDKLIDPEVLRTRLLNQVFFTIENYKTVSDDWQTVFGKGDDLYSWSPVYLNALDEQLISISMRDLLDDLIEFYNIMKDLPEANGYRRYSSQDVEENQQCILKSKAISDFIFDRDYIGVQMVSHGDDDPEWTRFQLVVYDGNDIVPREEEHDYELVRQNVQYISGNRYRMLLSRGDEDLVVAKDVQIVDGGSTILIFNNFQRVILYMIINLL